METYNKNKIAIFKYIHNHTAAPSSETTMAAATTLPIIANAIATMSSNYYCNNIRNNISNSDITRNSNNSDGNSNNMDVS